jgi:hypothetical protein
MASNRRFGARIPLAAVALAGGLLFSETAEPAVAEADTNNALVQRVRAELRSFTDWLNSNGARGFIGEVGWPRGGVRWNRLAERWFRDADRARLGVTVWATGEWWGPDYRLGIYRDGLPGTGVDTGSRGARVLESHLSGAVFLRGVNVAGAEFAAPAVDASAGFSNGSPGIPEEDYHYDSQATFDYLARRGVRVVRIPFRWERLQRGLGQPLDPGELGRLRGAVERAGRAGLKVVLDMHNYGAYYLAGDRGGVRRPIGSSEVTVQHFAEMWGRISNNFGGAPAVLGYGLMNEPVGLEAAEGLRPAEMWEKASQAALDRIRGNGDRKFVLVPGYEWSGVQTWTRTHPDAWINDPANRFLYEAHHYFDGDHSGTYKRTFAEETLASARGSARVKVRSGFDL